jgi:hypothetical protein
MVRKICIIRYVGAADGERVAMLWQLAWNDDRLWCAVYRRSNQLHLTVESKTAVIVTEPFDLEPRALARAQALREALKRRGWKEAV